MVVLGRHLFTPANRHGAPAHPPLSPRPPTADAADPAAGTAGHRWWRHVPFAVLLAAGIALRGAVAYAYRPAFEFYGDSYAYLRLTNLHAPDPMRPAGYPALLRLLAHTGDLWWVTVVQHVAGLAIGAAIYALLVHRRVAAPVAALAAAPVLLDAYQLVIEHFVMAETLFALLLVAAVIALTWSGRPPVWACGLAGLLLAAAGLVRTIGVAVGVLAMAYLLLRRVGWLRFAVAVVSLVVPLAGYAAWFHSAHGKYALTGGSAVWMYGRVAPIAECDRLHLSTAQLVLCSPHPVSERPDPSYYVWDSHSPARRLPADRKNALLTDFSHQVIRYQFGDYARMVGGEVAHYFAPGRPIGRRDWPNATWRFPTANEPRYLHNNEPLLGFHRDTPKRTIVEPYAGFLRHYQRFGYTPGPALAGMVVLAATAVVVPARWRRAPPGGRGRAARRRRRDQGYSGQGYNDQGYEDQRHHAPKYHDPRYEDPRYEDPRYEDRRLRADMALLVTAGVAMLVVPAATVCFDYRYLLPVLVLFPPAAALATRRAVLLRRARRHGGTPATEVPTGTAADWDPIASITSASTTATLAGRPPADTPPTRPRSAGTRATRRRRP